MEYKEIHNALFGYCNPNPLFTLGRSLFFLTDEPLQIHYISRVMQSDIRDQYHEPSMLLLVM